MALSQKSFKVYTTSDGNEYSEAGSYGKRAKSTALAHEKKISVVLFNRKFDLKVAKILGITKVTLDPNDPALIEDNWKWYEESNGPWDCEGGFDEIVKLLDDDSYCPGDMENAAQLVHTVQLWIKVLGGMTNIKKLNDLKVDGDLL